MTVNNNLDNYNLPWRDNNNSQVTDDNPDDSDYVRERLDNLQNEGSVTTSNNSGSIFNGRVAKYLINF